MKEATAGEQNLTNYSKAWEAFKATKEYHRAMTSMFEKGIINPYSQNILRIAFEAGWNATNTKIDFL